MSTAIGHDSHSDREAARAFCPSFLRKSSCFDDLGAHLLQFVGNIVFSSWLASTAYDYEFLAKNAFAGYYLILGATFHARVQRGKLWPLQWLPRTTVRNLLYLGLSWQDVDFARFSLIFQNHEPPGVLNKGQVSARTPLVSLGGVILVCPVVHCLLFFYVFHCFSMFFFYLW